MSTCEEAAVLLTWITLSRVAEGRVTTRGGDYLDGGAPLPPYLAASIPTLLTEGSLTLADPDPAGWQQLTLTEAGRSRIEQLRHREASEDIPGTSLPIRVPGAHLHPQLHRPPASAGPSTRGGRQV